MDRTRDTAMVALQGPLALTLVGLPVSDPFAFAEGVVCGVDALVARTGYTGEPGVELIVAAGDAVELWDGLLSARVRADRTRGPGHASAGDVLSAVRQ